MRIYRTTCYKADEPEVIDWVRYSHSKIQFAAAKSSWYTSYSRKPMRRIVLDVIEVQEEDWHRLEDTGGVLD